MLNKKDHNPFATHNPTPPISVLQFSMAYLRIKDSCNTQQVPQ